MIRYLTDKFQLLDYLPDSLRDTIQTNTITSIALIMKVGDAGRLEWTGLTFSPAVGLPDGSRSAAFQPLWYHGNGSIAGLARRICRQIATAASPGLIRRATPGLFSPLSLPKALVLVIARRLLITC